jgi:hypothetical protein
MQHKTDTSVSFILGDMNTMNPCSLIRAEKLDTQNGMRYSLNVCQLSLLLEETLSNKPVPITTLIPIELIHSFGEGSK